MSNSSRLNLAIIALSVPCLLLFGQTRAAAADFTPPDKGKALETLKSDVAEAAKSGKKIDVWLSIFGSIQKTVLVKADAKTVSIKIDGNNNFDQPWEKISPEQIAGIGKNCVQGDAQRALNVADYCMATEQRKLADAALELAATSSQTLGAQLADRWKFVKAMPANAPAAAAVALASPSEGSGGSAPAPKAAAPAKAVVAAPAATPAPVKEVAAVPDFTPPDKEKALEALKGKVIEAAKLGKKIDVWLTILGQLQKTVLVKADAKNVSVKIDGDNVYDQPWDKISPEQIAGLAKNCILNDGQRGLAAADYCMALELREKAEAALDLAGQTTPPLGAQLSSRWKFVKAMAGGSTALAVASVGGDSSGSEKKVVAPNKIAFTPSESGNLTPIKDVAAAIDNAVEIDLADMNIKPEALCDDCAFLRRASLDLTGQIPSPEEVIKFYQSGGGSDKRAKKIEEILARPDYADHWATFWDVILIGRRTQDQDDVKVGLFRSWLREQFSKNEGFDRIVTQILTAQGDARKVGPANYLAYHLDSTLPITMAHISQTFLGARIGCAQCHDHPFDKWSQQDFWGFASFMANTASERRERKEKDAKEPTGERVVERWRELTDQDARNGGGKYDPPQNELLLPPKALDGPVFTMTAPAKAATTDLGKDLKKGGGMDAGKGMGMAMDADKGMAAKKGMDSGSDKSMGMDKGMDKGMAGKDGMAGGMAGMMGSAVTGAGGSRGLTYRKALAAWITDEKNEKFSQSAVNRIWRAMFGYGLVEPVDDIRPKNPASHPEVMKILADDFNASGRDWKRLCAVIANTKAYQRAANGSLAKIDRAKEVRYAARAEVRPMTPEMLFTAIMKSTGGEETAKTLLADLRSRDDAMAMAGMGGTGGMAAMKPEVGQYYELMRRFINTSTAEDRAGKLQFEGTVSQALMMMHDPFMLNGIKTAVKRFKKDGMGDMVYVFAATLGRPPDSAEAGAFGSGKLDDVMWILLNSAEFVTIH